MRLALALLCAALLVSAAAARQALAPGVNFRVTSASRQYAGRALPFVISEPQTAMRGTVILTLGPRFPRWYSIWAAGRLQEFTVNGNDIPHAPQRSSIRGVPGIYDLGAVLHEGSNVVTFAIDESGRLRGGFDIRPAVFDPMLAFVTLLQTAAATMLVLLVAGARLAPFRGALALGAAVRVLYFLCTPILRRGFDDNEHLQYIALLADSWQLPMWNAGRELHQPPLYYALMGALGRATGALVPAWAQPDALFQPASLVFSILALAAGLWILARIFPNASAPQARVVAAALYAVLPAEVLFAGRLGNDAPSEFLMLLFLAAVISWLPLRNLLRWCTAMCLGVLALLTKITSLMVLGPAAVMPLFLCVRPRRTALLVLSAAAIFAAGCGWYFALRAVQMGGNFSLGGGLPGYPETRLSSSALDVFLPVHYRELLSSVATPKAVLPYYWESLLYSVFIGSLPPQHELAPAAFLTLFLGVCAVPLVIFGALKDLRTGAVLCRFLAAISVTALVCMLTFRLVFLNFYLQDIRFAPPLMLLSCFYAGESGRRAHLAARAGRFLLALLAASSVIWVVSASVVT